MKHPSQLFIFLIISILSFSCEDKLYFDAAPSKANTDALKVEMKKRPEIDGVYLLNYCGLDSIGGFSFDGFKANKYENYLAPKIDTTDEDSLGYFWLNVFLPKYVKISIEGGVCKFTSLACVNRSAFNNFFSRGFRFMKKENKTTFVSVKFRNDSIIAKIISADDDTVLKYRVWILENLICFETKNKEFFPNQLDLTKEKLEGVSFIDNKIYFSKNKSRNDVFEKEEGEQNIVKIVKYDVSQLTLAKNKFELRTLNEIKNYDAILKAMRVQCKGDIIHMDEAQLKRLFNSPLALTDIIANKIEGFPELYEGNLLDRYTKLLVIVSCVLALALVYKIVRL